MTATKQTTIWCDHPDPRGVAGHGRDHGTEPRCVEWVQLDSGDAGGARREARRLYGWSIRKGIGDCCPDHSRKATP